MIVSEPVQADVFIPFSITLTFENQEEVNDLYNRVNLSRYKVQEASVKEYYRNIDLTAPCDDKLFEILRRFV